MFSQNRIFRRVTLDTKAKIITISSGKGGVGKTCTSVNLAILLAQQGYKVCLLDADANLANVNIMLKLTPKFTLHDIISGKKSLRDITLHKAGIYIIPGASGLTDFISLTTAQQQRMLKTMQDLKSKYDYVIIDNPAGINENVLSYIKFSDHGIIVISPEPTSLTDAFALIRVLQKRGNRKVLNVIVNNAPHDQYALKVFNRFLAAVKKHIGCQLNYLGCVVADDKIPTSVSLQNPVVLQFPTAPSVRNYHKLSVKLTHIQQQTDADKPLKTIDKTPQQPDFSTNAAYLKQDRIMEPATDGLDKKPLVTEELKIALIDQINDKNTEEATLKVILQQINAAYLKRFGGYVIDIPQVLHDAMKMDRISQSTMKNLIMTLEGLYQDQYGIPLKDKATSIPTESKEKNLKQETAELLIKLLQEDNPAESEVIDNVNEHTGPKLVPTLKSRGNTNQDLIDSIRYAAMVDK